MTFLGDRCGLQDASSPGCSAAPHPGARDGGSLCQESGWAEEGLGIPVLVAPGHSVTLLRAWGGAPSRQGPWRRQLPCWPPTRQPSQAARQATASPGQALCLRGTPDTTHCFLLSGLQTHFRARWVAFGQSQLFRPRSPSPCKAPCERGVGAPRGVLCVLEPGRETNQKAISKNSQHRVGTVWAVASSHGPPGWPAGDEGAGMSCLPDPDRPGSPGGPQWALYLGGV